MAVPWLRGQCWDQGPGGSPEGREKQLGYSPLVVEHS